MAVGIPLGPYRLVRRLATGGMAEIFLARQEGPDGFARELVVKRILPHLAADPEFRRMFRDEAKLAALLSHPNVVHVYDFGAVQDAEDTTLYLAMELVRGVDLRALILRALSEAKRAGRPGAIPPHHAAKIASFVCEALAHAHAVRIDGRPAGIVHRDVTPSNVLLSFDGAVKLADFGIAKAAVSRTDETELGVVKGKYTYLSPEQARGEALDARSDLFNVGILLFESALGEALFPPSDQRLSRRLSAEGQLPRPERLDRLPPALASIAKRALAPRREDRYPDALALRSELETYLRASAEPSDTVELGRFVRQLCAEELQEDAQGPRAAGTIAGTHEQQWTRELTGPPPEAGAAQGTAITRPARPSTAVATLLTAKLARPATEPLADTGTTDPTATAIADGAEPLTGGLTHADTPDPFDASALVPAADTSTGLTVGAAGTPIVRPERRPSHAWWIALAIVTSALVVALAVVAGSGGGAGGTRAGTAVLPRSARLTIQSDPAGARVFVDGVEHGVTPALLTSVTAGRTMRIDLRDAAGRVLDAAELTLAEGEARTLALRATPLRALLRVTSTPEGSRVSVDGAPVGATPLEHDVPLGEHRVRVEADGFAPAEDVVRVETPGERASISFALRPVAERATPPHARAEPAARGDSARTLPRGATGTLRVATTPWSEVFEGGRRLGETPLQVELPEGRHTLTLRAPERPARTEVVDIRAGEVTRVRIVL
jgi:serine/threonine-protein kinase